ncbi:MAG TPA: NAD(P)/FAD-dependent oxidoreductase [Candidatus Paceibacterota bacterium]
MHTEIRKPEDTLWDVAVIGGGPAGMMAAGRAAERGAKVILLEKNPILGKKLLITGGGRCNVTNAELDTRKLLDKFKENNKYLFSAFSQWSVKETLDFFHGRLMETKEEAEKRVFPATNKAESVWKVLVEYIKKGDVTILSKTEVTGFKKERAEITAVILKNKKEIRARSFILATGGKSHPETGSTGEGFQRLRSLGHTVAEPQASLVPLTLRDEWVKRLAGVSLQNIKISLFQNDVKQSSVAGKILFTHVGVSGPTILNLSGEVSELLKYGEVKISLDLFPTLDHGMLNQELQDLFKEHSNKKFKNSLGNLITPALCPAIIELSGIDPETWSNSITREERMTLIALLKNISLNVKGLLGVEKAIITSGGVKLDEIDFKTMRSRIVPNLYLVGDVLNIDRPSGGYSLQLCWTTGFVAGNSVPLK